MIYFKYTNRIVERGERLTQCHVLMMWRSFCIEGGKDEDGQPVL